MKYGVMIKTNTIKTLDQLEKYTEIQMKDKKDLHRILCDHPMAVTPYYMDLIDFDDPDDPLRKMTIPSTDEKELQGKFDTSGEGENTRIRGLQHKYRETALILTTNKCALYCRHCFRKRLVGTAADEIAQDWDPIIAYLQKHREITNVLLSGGDALMRNTEDIADTLNRLAAVDHLQYVRIGTRIPVVMPKRILEDDALIELLKTYNRDKKPVYLVTQFNHHREITQSSRSVIKKLKQNGITINNQTVLLKGVNDNPADMAKLQRTLVRIGVIPYYIFQCRPTARVRKMFQIPLRDGIEIINETKARLSGLAKRFRYVMSHKTGKIEILGLKDNRILFRYHQTKDKSLEGHIFEKELDDETGWLAL